MGEPVVLPKFELPGEKPHWVIRAAWIAGGLLLFSVVGLGVAIVHHRSLETQAHIARAEALAKVKAEADAKVATVAAVAKAQREAELAAKAPAQTVPATTLAATAPSLSANAAAGMAGPTTKAGAVRRSHATRGSKSVRSGAKVASKGDSRSTANKPDAIDELLKRMK